MGGYSCVDGGINAFGGRTDWIGAKNIRERKVTCIKYRRMNPKYSGR